jgi:hypothetical protein
VTSNINRASVFDHKERKEHKEMAVQPHIGGVFALFVFFVAKNRPSLELLPAVFSAAECQSLCVSCHNLPRVV